MWATPRVKCTQRVVRFTRRLLANHVLAAYHPRYMERYLRTTAPEAVADCALQPLTFTLTPIPNPSPDPDPNPSPNPNPNPKPNQASAEQPMPGREKEYEAYQVPHP